MIKRTVILIALLASTVSAAGPKYNYRDPKLNDEIENIYHDIGNSTNEPAAMAPPSRTLAQLKTVTPTKKGLMFYCSDCTTDTVCVSTGATIFGFSRISARTTSCQ